MQIETRVSRDAFESWIAPEVTAIGACVDRVLDEATIRPTDIDRVFLTGGSSFVPSVRRIFLDRFDEQRLAGGDELLSIASGLALRARARLA